MALTNTFAQQLTVTDARTGEPIAYVAVSNQAGFGTYSDEQGLISYPFKPSDTLRISHVAFVPVVIAYQAWLAKPSYELPLLPLEINLPAVKVLPNKGQAVEVGYF